MYQMILIALATAMLCACGSAEKPALRQAGEPASALAGPVFDTQVRTLNEVRAVQEQVDGHNTLLRQRLREVEVADFGT